MPASTASALWNTGRRVWAFLLLITLPLTAQPLDERIGERLGGVSRITLEPIEQTQDVSGHRLIWRSHLDGIQKISVSAPRVRGLWLRVSNDDDPFSWKFVTLETGCARDFIFGATRARASFQLQYDQIGPTSSVGDLPVVFTLTES